MRQTNGTHWLLLCALLLAGAFAATGCGDDKKPGDGDPDILDGGPDSDDPDAGPPFECRVSDPCTVATMCGDGNECQGELQLNADFDIGGADDPIVDHPTDEDTAYDVVLFQNGYCTPRGLPLNQTDVACDPADNTGCDACSRCVNLFAGLPFCARECVPSRTENDCPSGYSCLSLSTETGVCVPGGCSVDEECHIKRVDSNDNGVIDPFDATDNPTGDNLKYFTSTDIPDFTAECDDVLAICRHSGTAAAEAGKVCDHDFECEADGSCLGGVCSKFDCDLPGNACAGDGECIGGACYEPCQVADHAGGPTAPHDTCAAGMGCFPNAGADLPNNGVCLPANFNDVAVNNVGAPCQLDTDCYSPYGLGRCYGEGTGTGVCTIDYCDAPGLTTVCGAGTQCIPFAQGEPGLCWKDCDAGEDCGAGSACYDIGGGDSICFAGGCNDNPDCPQGTCNATSQICELECTAATDCAAGQACRVVTEQEETEDRCAAGCVEAADCRAGEACNIPPGFSVGRCVPT